MATNKRDNKNEGQEVEKDKPQNNINSIRLSWDAYCENFNKNPEKAYAALGYAYNNSPYVQNQRAKRVSSQPLSTSRESLSNALTNPPQNELLLRQVSQSLFSNYPLLKLNHLYADILTYRYYFYSKYTTSKDIRSPAYKEEREKLSKWIDSFQPKRTFQNIILKLQKEGKCAYYMRDSFSDGGKETDYAYLQELPSDYFKIIGWNTASGYTISFNFTYFWLMGTTPLQFPPIFQKYYEELNRLLPDKGVGIIGVNPTDMSDGAEIYYKDNKWFYWHTLPLDECFVFSQDETVPWHLPNSIGLFLQAEDLQDYAYVQQEILKLQTSAVIMGTMPLNKDANGSTATDNYGMGTEAHAFFTNAFNNAAPPGVKMFINPATDFKFFTFDNQSANNSIILTNALQQFNSTAGVGGLNSTTDKPNMAQVKTQQIMEGAYVEKIYSQFIKFIDVWWKDKLGLKFDWRFKIKGMRFQDELDFPKVEKGLTLGQNYLLPEYLSFFGLTLDDITSMQEEVISSGVYKKFEILKNSFSSKDTASKNGRPAKSEEEIESDGTASGVQQGSNLAENRLMSLKYCAECGEPLNEDGNNEFYPFCCAECAEENQERIGGETV